VPLHEAHLADTSAWSKARNDPALAAVFDDAGRRGLIYTCDMIALELLRSAQNHERFTRQAAMLANFDSCPIGTAEISRAREVQTVLSTTGQHRGVKPVDLLIAAAAEAAAVPVLHYDHDFDLIAEVTGQPVWWIAERGSLA
jgi:predicted nucleic acid-binding protein